MFFKIGGTYYVVLYEIQFTRRWNRGRVFVMGWDGIWKDDCSFTVESRETLETFVEYGYRFYAFGSLERGAGL